MSFKSLDVLLNPNKIIPHYKKIIDCGTITSMPISAEFHWTSNCNYDCIHCSYGSRRETTNYLKNNIIESIVDELIEMKCKAVYLSGGGEPTIIKKWNVYADKLINNGIEVALITNGIAVQEKHICVAQKMNYIAVSVYSTKEDRYEKITDSKHFEEQFSLPKRIKRGNGNVIIGARCVLNEINYDELYDIYCAALNEGFDYIIFIPAVDYEGRGIVLKDKWIELVQDSIRENLDKFDHTRTNVNSLLKRKVSHYSDTDYLEYTADESEECKALSIGSCVFFNYDGGVYLCQPDIGRKDLEIGNVNNDSLKNIWNSSKHKEVMDKLNKRWSIGGCANCRSIAFNKAIDSYERNLVDTSSIEMDYFL